MDFPIISTIMVFFGGASFYVSNRVTANTLSEMQDFVTRNRISATFLMVFGLLVRFVWGW